VYGKKGKRLVLGEGKEKEEVVKVLLLLSKDMDSRG